MGQDFSFVTPIQQVLQVLVHRADKLYSKWRLIKKLYLNVVLSLALCFELWPGEHAEEISPGNLAKSLGVKLVKQVPPLVLVHTEQTGLFHRLIIEPGSIECFIDGQAFSSSVADTLNPLSRQLARPATQRKTEKERQLAAGQGGRGLGGWRGSESYDRQKGPL